MDFMSLLGSMIQGTTASSPAASQRMSNAGGGIQDLLGSLMGAGQSVKDRVGGDNLAAGGIGALLGALMGGSKSTTMNSLGGGMMGLLGMMAYKALKNSMGSSSSGAAANAQAYTPATPQQQASDAEIILIAMIDAAKADGQIDSEEFNRIMNNLKSSGVGQDGMNYVLQKLQGPMETSRIVSATQGRPDLAAQVYSASLMTIDVDTDAERQYLDKLARAMGLSQQVIENIEQLTGPNSKEYMC